ncbi:MAG TPA: hypothetical protein VF306_12820 [Pirellulales bacterium]
MPLIFRVMTPDGDKPKVGNTARTLGVRLPPNPKPDIELNSDGTVEPGRGGMSVSPDLQSLPSHRVPIRYIMLKPDAQGRNKHDVCWRMGTGPFVDGVITDRLVLRLERDGHGFVEPAYRMSLSEYQSALAATQGDWIALDP